MLANIYKKAYDPDATAIKFKGNSISYGELDDAVNHYATFFYQLGVKDGKRVILTCPNSPEFIYSYFGVVKTGAIIVPINVQLTIEEINYFINDSEAEYMIIHPKIIENLNQSQESLQRLLGIKLIVLDQVFQRAIAEISPIKLDQIADEKAISTFLYTSGTTVQQKAAMLTHKNLLVNAEQCRIAFDALPSDNYLCVLPMFHVYGFTICVLTPLCCGGTVTILEGFHPHRVINSLLNDDITVFSGVPSMYVLLLEAAKKNNITFSNLRFATCGGSSLPGDVLRQARDILNIPIVEGYGLTEASPGVCFNPLYGIQKQGSIGLPFPYVKCRIVDEDDMDVPVGEVGELLVQGENVMLGYYKQEQETQETLRNGWLHTGDLAWQDKDGYYYIAGRKKDLIIVGGLNVYPSEIEEAIYQYPKVKEAAVVGIQDKLRGEFVKAFIVLKEGEECTAKDISKYLREQIASYKIPREIEFVPELPKNVSGKILKRILKTM
jgi:long-chain acyl-CoA synthetase